MRKLFAVAILLTASFVHAGTDLEFGDLNYFLNEGQFNFNLDADVSFYKETRNNETLETRGYLFRSRYGYGVSDKLTAFVTLDYAYDLVVKNLTTTSNAGYSQDGLSNPGLGALYRFMRQGSDHYNVDFGALAKISLLDAETGAASGRNSNDGTYAAPRSSVELNAAIGRKWNEANEWRVSGGVVYHASGERTVRAISGDVQEDLDSSMDLFVKAAYQYRPVQTFMMEVSAQATRLGELEYERGATSVTEEAHVDLDFIFMAKYLITESFILRFDYGKSNNQNIDVQDGNTSYQVKARRENYWGLGFDFLF